MLSLRTSGIEWSLGSRPYWELGNGDDEMEPEGEAGLQSVADSLIVLQSLRQSREKWLTSTFPKFSTKSRGGKPAEIVPPPHTIHNRGRCDIKIGPHIFPNTVIFEVHYQYLQHSASKPMYLYQPPAHGQTSSWQTTTPYGAIPYMPYGQRPLEHLSTLPTIPASTEAAVSQNSSAPLLSSLGSSVSITPALISQVNSAASSNPTLANLLQLAASGKATPEQLKTLGLLIQSLAGSSNGEGSPNTPRSVSASGTPQPDATSKASTPAPALSSQSPTCISALKAPTLHPAFVPSKEFDLVLEFAENPSDRWTLPRAPAVVECLPGDGPANDILLTTGAPFAKLPLPGAEKEKTDFTTDDAPQELVTFRFAKASSDIWSCISRWAGAQEKMDITRRAFERMLGKEAEKVYLAHQLPEGALLSQIRNSAMPPYTTKSIRPVQADTTKPKRVRKPAAPKSADVVGPPPSKKKRQGKIATPLPKIACVACGKTDVPLIMGGRYCRPCAGPEPQTYPGTPQNGGTFMHKFWAGPNPGQFVPQPVINHQPLVNPQPAINPQPDSNPPSQPADLQSNIQPHINPQPAINSRPDSNPPSQLADLQSPPAAPTIPKRKKSSAKVMPDSDPPAQSRQSSSSSKKKRSK